MVENRKYNRDEIDYVLARVLAGWKPEVIARAFRLDHEYWRDREFTRKQVMYLKNTYKVPFSDMSPYTGPQPPSPEPVVEQSSTQAATGPSSSTQAAAGANYTMSSPMAGPSYSAPGPSYVPQVPEYDFEGNLIENNPLLDPIESWLAADRTANYEGKGKEPEGAHPASGASHQPFYQGHAQGQFTFDPVVNQGTEVPTFDPLEQPLDFEEPLNLDEPIEYNDPLAGQAGVANTNYNYQSPDIDTNALEIMGPAVAGVSGQNQEGLPSEFSLAPGNPNMDHQTDALMASLDVDLADTNTNNPPAGNQLPALNFDFSLPSGEANMGDYLEGLSTEPAHDADNVHNPAAEDRNDFVNYAPSAGVPASAAEGPSAGFVDSATLLDAEVNNLDGDATATGPSDEHNDSNAQYPFGDLDFANTDDFLSGVGAHVTGNPDGVFGGTAADNFGGADDLLAGVGGTVPRNVGQNVGGSYGDELFDGFDFNNFAGGSTLGNDVGEGVAGPFSQMQLTQRNVARLGSPIDMNMADRRYPVVNNNYFSGNNDNIYTGPVNQYSGGYAPRATSIVNNYQFTFQLPESLNADFIASSMDGVGSLVGMPTMATNHQQATLNAADVPIPSIETGFGMPASSVATGGNPEDEESLFQDGTPIPNNNTTPVAAPIAEAVAEAALRPQRLPQSHALPRLAAQQRRPLAALPHRREAAPTALDHDHPPGYSQANMAARDSRGFWYAGRHDLCHVRGAHRHDMDGGVHFASAAALDASILATGATHGIGYRLGLTASGLFAPANAGSIAAPGSEAEALFLADGRLRGVPAEAMAVAYDTVAAERARDPALNPASAAYAGSGLERTALAGADIRLVSLAGVNASLPEGCYWDAIARRVVRYDLPGVSDSESESPVANGI